MIFMPFNKRLIHYSIIRYFCSKPKDHISWTRQLKKLLKNKNEVHQNEKLIENAVANICNNIKICDDDEKDMVIQLLFKCCVELNNIDKSILMLKWMKQSQYKLKNQREIKYHSINIIKLIRKCCDKDKELELRELHKILMDDDNILAIKKFILN